MPKPGKYNNKPSWKNQYSEHDNRDIRGGGQTRKVAFKTGRHGGKNDQTRDWGPSVRAYIDEEDIDMGINTGSSFQKRHFKGKKGGRRLGSPPPQGKRKLFEGPTSWYRVTLPHGNKYDKEFILQILLEKLQPMPLWPIMWTVNGNIATFYVDEFKIADKLFNLDRQIQLPDGFKLIIRVHSGSPNVDINPQMKEKIKLTMAKRYNPNTKALDLSKFHADPDLQDLFCALFKPVVLLAVIDIIAENIPELEALNLFDNKISILSHLKKVNTKLPKLKILHMGNNKLRDMSMLDPLSGLPLVDLLLDGNPLCNKFKERTSYISEARKRFPKLMKLDGQDLPPPISFDVSNEITLPNSNQTFLCNQEGEAIVREFLAQYFLLFDSENRQPLLQAYHEHAMFSMTMSYPYGYGKDKSEAWLNWYQTDNRNLLRVQDRDRRNKLLKQGQLAVVSFLQEMPATKHDIHTFTVDLTFFTPVMIVLAVSGIFKEVKSGRKVPPIRYFFRNIIIVPAGSGFCIANEEVHITNATPDQASKSFKTPAVNPVPQNVMNSPNAPAQQVPVLDDLTKQQMIQAMAEQSGMNLDWSLKCVAESLWDFQKAMLVFSELHRQGAIPPEAFIK